MKKTLDKKILDTQFFKNNSLTLCERSIELVDIQVESWSLLNQNYKNLEHSETKTIPYGNTTLELIHNPDRIKSTSADTSDDAIINRDCFLCYKNLPPEQRALKYFSNYLILANPYPIKKYHLTLPKIDHVKQSLLHSIDDLLNLAKELSCNFTIYYNGPKCGASAPDHQHFQALPKNSTTLDAAICSSKLTVVKTIKYEGAVVYYSDSDFRNAIVIESINRNTIRRLLLEHIKLYNKMFETTGEPMLNAACFFHQHKWFVTLFFRNKHRPSNYYLKSNKQVLFSPAAIDLAGCMVFPRQEDYEAVDFELIKTMLNEVIISKEMYYYLREKIISIL